MLKTVKGKLDRIVEVDCKEIQWKLEIKVNWKRDHSFLLLWKVQWSRLIEQIAGVNLNDIRALIQLKIKHVDIWLRLCFDKIRGQKIVLNTKLMSSYKALIFVGMSLCVSTESLNTTWAMVILAIDPL